MGITSFTINDERMKQVNMVSYFKAGSQWATAAGNPKGVDPENACGKNIAVQSNTTQELDDLPVRQKKCGSNKINVLSLKDQSQATAAVVSGKADAMLADSPVVAYAVKQSGGKLEPLGDIYEAAPYGYVLPKDETEFAEAIVEALDPPARGRHHRLAAKLHVVRREQLAQVVVSHRHLRSWRAGGSRRASRFRQPCRR